MTPFTEWLQEETDFLTHTHMHTQPWFYWIQSQSKQPAESSALFRVLNQRLDPGRGERTRGEVGVKRRSDV